MKVKEGFDVYDELPEDMIAYLRYNGRHFNRRLVEFATSKMTTRDSNGTEICKIFNLIQSHVYDNQEDLVDAKVANLHKEGIVIYGINKSNTSNYY